MATRSFSLRGALTDIACVLLLGLASLLLYLFDEPVRRGFFCDDESIRYPVPTSQTVSDEAVALVAVGVPIIVVTVTEIWRAGLTQPTSLVLLGWTPQVWMVQCYAYIGWFLFGGGTELVTVEAGKRLVGRLRPHFLAACFNVGFNCSSASYEYITDYTCTGDPDVIKEARLSFPSGHSSLSFYAATFTVMYLQIRMVWESSKLLKHLLQFVLVMAAWVTALTRVSDYMHHWSDVLAGMVIGTLFGFLTMLFISILHRKHLGSQPMELMTLLRRSNPPSATTDNCLRGHNQAL